MPSRHPLVTGCQLLVAGNSFITLPKPAMGITKQHESHLWNYFPRPRKASAVSEAPSFDVSGVGQAGNPSENTQKKLAKILCTE